MLRVLHTLGRGTFQSSCSREGLQIVKCTRHAPALGGPDWSGDWGSIHWDGSLQVQWGPLCWGILPSLLSSAPLQPNLETQDCSGSRDVTPAPRGTLLAFLFCCFLLNLLFTYVGVELIYEWCLCWVLSNPVQLCRHIYVSVSSYLWTLFSSRVL